MGTAAAVPALVATGGVVTVSGGYATHTFTTNGTFTVSSGSGTIEIFAWGAGGAGGTVGGWTYGAPGGGGGAAYGTLPVVAGDTYYVSIGGAGQVNSTTSATGGGGIASRSQSDNRYGSGGGGYSGVFTAGTDSQAAALIIAGGGGGGGSSRAGTGNAGGAGGGTVGQNGFSPYDSKTAYAGQGGTQIAAGADASCDSANASGFQAALLGGTCRVNSYGGAGGGGYWGGSAGGYSEANTMAGGGGGSGYFKLSAISGGQLTTGAASAPGDSSNILRGNAGLGGDVGATGTNGRVIIRYTSTANTTNYSLLTYTVSANLAVLGNGTGDVNIFKTSGSASWDNQAYSTTAFTAPCTIEFFKTAATTDNGISYAMIGWNEDPLTDASYSSLDYAAYPYRADTYSVYNNSAQVNFTDAWDINKKFYVVYDADGYIRHYNGSTLLYFVNYGTGRTVYVDSSFYSVSPIYGGFSNIRVAPRSWDGTKYVDSYTGTVPGAPTIGTATATGYTSANIAFTAPASDGGNPITRYRVTSSGGQTATGSSSPITINNLANGTTYTFTVAALNSRGYGAESASSNQTTTTLLLDGSSVSRANTSAAAIKALTGTNTDGVYYINLPTVGVKPIYCIMNSSAAGGGWMMAFKATRGTTFSYSSSHWNSVTTLNTGSTDRSDADAKFDTMNYYQGNSLMALFPDITTNGGGLGSNPYGCWSWYHANYMSGYNRATTAPSGSTSTMINYFGSVNRVFYQDAKTWNGWQSGIWSSQADIRFYGFNWTDNLNSRWGFGWNENGGGLFPNGAEGSDDVSGGIGTTYFSAGDQINCCQDSTGINRSARVEVYIK